MRSRLHHAGALVAFMTAVDLISSSVEVAAITIAGYTTDTDVTEHSELDLDVEEIEDLSDAYDFDGAYDIYANGKYSEKTDSTRTIQGFSTDTEKLSGEKWFDIYEAYWGAPDYADVFTSAACEGTGNFTGESDVVRAECCTKGAQYQNIWMYVIHELEDAIADCNNKDLTDNDGGVEAWDEGWAFWAGSLEGEDGTGDGVMGYALADNRCTQFGTCTGDYDDNDYEGTSAVNYELLTLYNKGKSKLQDFECDDVEVIKEEIVTLMTVPLVQGLLRYVYLADPNVENEADEQDKERAELWAFSAAVLPQIDNCDSDVAEFIRSNTDITSNETLISAGYVGVKEKLESVYSCMGIKCSQVGGYLADDLINYVEGMEPCTIMIAGYTSDTNVTEHSELDLDVAEIEDLSDAYDFDGAYDIYANGKYSEKTDSIRTIQGFSTDAEEKLFGEKWFEIYEAYWGEPDYADVFTSAACEGTGNFTGESDVVRAECCTKGAQYQNIWMYVIHELEDAIKDCNNEDLTDNDGGVEAWDEGWAFWAGSLEGEDGEGDGVMGYALADSRCTQFGTCTGDDDDDDDDDSVGTSAVNHELLTLYNKGKSKLQDFECDDVEVIKEEIVTLMTVPLIQGLLRYVYLADPNVENEADEQDKERAELWAFSAAVLPQIDNCDSEVADFIRSNTDITSTEAPISAGYVGVKEKLESVYSCMGITCYQVGGYLADDLINYVDGMGPCIGMMIAGYTADSDVTEHSELDLDMEEIEDLSDAYDFDGAYNIYANGKYSEKTDSIRTIQGFSTDAQEKLSGEKWFDIYEAYWSAPNYADVFTSAACNGDGYFAGESYVVRAECCAKGAQYQNIWMYVIHELEDAIADCNNEDLSANNGGVEAWDEGWAFWAGSLEGEDGEGDGVMGYALADNRCTQFGTCTGDDDDNDFEGTSAVNYELLELYNEGKSKLEDFECDDVEDIKEEIVTLMTVPLIQGLLRYVYLADPNVENEDDEQDKERAELWAFSAAVLPQIDNCDSEVAEFIRSNTDITSDDAPISDGYEAVKEKLESVYSCMDIKCSQIGGYSTDGSTYVEGMEPCSDSSNGTEDWEIAVGVIVALIVVGAAICLCVHCRRKKRARQAQAQAKTMGDDVGGFEMETGTSTL